MSGIRSMSDLRDRCFIDQITGCWHWRGATSGGCPSCWFPLLDRRSCSLGTIIGFLRTGVEPARGVVWHVTCATPNCANPDHRSAGDRSSQMLAAKIKRSVLTRGRMAVAKRTKLTQAAVDDIRASAEPLRIVAARHGVAISTCSHVRRLEMWKPQGVSAFSRWSGAT